MKPDLIKLQDSAIDLLKKLIVIPSFSREEGNTATVLVSLFGRD